MPPSMLLLVLAIGAMLLVTPILTVYLLVRASKLRSQLNQLTEDTTRRFTAMSREIIDLRRKLSEIPHPSTPPAEERHVPAPAPVAQQPLPVPQPQPTPREPVLPIKIEIPAEPKPVQPPQQPKPPVFVEPKEPPKPVVPPVTQPHVAPPPPPTPPATTTPKPPAPAQPPAQVPHPPIVPPVPRPHTEPLPAAARVTTPPPLSAYRAPAPAPSFQQRMKRVSSIEETLGTNWLLKIGIVALVIGIAYFGAQGIERISSAGRALLCFAASLLLLIGGIRIEKRERYELLGRSLIGGGWAALFFSAFGSYYINGMRLFSPTRANLTLDCIFMLVVAVAMGLHTLRYRSQYVTGLAFLLGYTTVALSQEQVYSLSAGAFLAIGLVLIVRKMNWFELEVFGILSSYLNHLYWLYRILGPDGAQGHAFEAYTASTAILFFYWLIFRLSYVLREVKSTFEEHVSTAAAILNTLLLLGVMKFQSVQPKLAWLALLAVGALEFHFAQYPITRRRREAFIVLTVLGTALMTIAVPSRYSGDNIVALLWLVGAEVFLIAGVMFSEVVFRRLGLLLGLLVGAHLIGFDFRNLAEFRLHSEARVLDAGVLFGLCAVVFYANVLIFGSRWRELFSTRLDDSLLTLYSYLGAFSGGTAVWALFSHDRTAIAFAVVMLLVAILARKFDSRHFHVQYALLGVLTFYRTIAINLHLEAANHLHVKMRLLTLPILGAIFYVCAKLSALQNNQAQRLFRGLFSLAGTALFTLLIWFEVPDLWQPFAFILFAVLLSEAARYLRYPVAAIHTHIVSFFAFYTVFSVSGYGFSRWHTIPLHALAALPVILGCYWIAKRLGTEHERHLSLSRIAYTWVSSALMLWVLHEALATPWIAVGWIVFAVALALSARYLKYSQLAWQANAVGLLAAVYLFANNFELDRTLWLGLSLRVVTVSIVAAGLYFLSRAAAPNEQFKRPIAFLHSFAATGLLALLAFYEYPNGWLAPLWALFALVLALVDRRFDLEELPWQSHSLALMAAVRAVLFNLHDTATWHNLDVRLLSLSIVAVIFYALSRAIRMPEEWRDHDIHHIYSWAASTIVSLLLWYELQPLSIAVGWAVFGLVLFEYGLLRKIRQFRFQAYIALLASFIRIFFANLTASNRSDFWGDSTITILPLTLIFFFIYAQLPNGKSQKSGGQEELAEDHHQHFDALLACLGTATIVALFYFQFPIEWVVTSWAAVVFILFAVAWLLNRRLFLIQGLLLTLGVVVRGFAHNLFGAGYHADREWTGRYFILGSAVAILLTTLFFAFQLRERFGAPATKRGLAKGFSWILYRPEQFQFFAAAVLLSFLLGIKMRAGMVTVSWGIEGFLIILFALVVKERSFRLSGLGLLLLCVAKVVLMDIWGLQTRDRYITLIIVGTVLVTVSYLYTRYRETLRQLL